MSECECDVFSKIQNKVQTSERASISLVGLLMLLLPIACYVSNHDYRS